MTELTLLESKAQDQLKELIRIQNKKPVKSLEEFHKQWIPDKEADKLFDFIMQERKERREKIKK